MTDNTDPTSEIPTASEATFDKETIKRLGDRGSGVLEHEQKTTDIDTLDEQVDVTITSFCNCGDPITVIENAYRCCACDDFCCTECRITLSRYNYCPACARHEYNATKQVYLMLYLLEEGVLSVEELVTTDTANDTLTVTIDTAASTLIEHGYITIGNGGAPDSPIALSEDDPLSVAGKEALHVGEQLYSDDPDIEELKDQLVIRQAVNDH